MLEKPSLYRPQDCDMIKSLETEAGLIVKQFFRLFNVLQNDSPNDKKVLTRLTAKSCIKISHNNGLYCLVYKHCEKQERKTRSLKKKKMFVKKLGVGKEGAQKANLFKTD